MLTPSESRQCHNKSGNYETKPKRYYAKPARYFTDPLRCFTGPRHNRTLCYYSMPLVNIAVLHRDITSHNQAIPLQYQTFPRHCYSTPTRSTQCFTVTWLFYAMPAPNPASLYRYFAHRYCSVARLHLAFRHSTATLLFVTSPRQNRSGPCSTITTRHLA